MCLRYIPWESTLWCVWAWMCLGIYIWICLHMHNGGEARVARVARCFVVLAISDYFSLSSLIMYIVKATVHGVVCFWLDTPQYLAIHYTWQDSATASQRKVYSIWEEGPCISKQYALFQVWLSLIEGFASLLPKDLAGKVFREHIRHSPLRAHYTDESSNDTNIGVT